MRWAPFTIVLLSAALPSCSKARAERAQLPASAEVPPTPIRVMKPSTQPSAADTRATATVRSKNEATLSAKTTAQIKMLDVQVGDRVKKGQVLARLDASMASIGLQNAKAAQRLAVANLANARTELQRGEALRAEGALADASFDKIKMAFDIASAQADQAAAAVRASSQQVSDSTLTAPFEGVVSARFKNPGDTVSAMPPTPLLSLVDPEHLEVRMLVPEALAPLLHVGDTLTAVASPAELKFSARVSALGAAVDPLSRTVEVLADVADPIDPLLRPGTLATVDLSTSPSVKGFYLPASAVRTEGGKSFVLVANANRLQRKEVVSSVIKPGSVLVTSGLGASDEVAVDTTGLRDGDTVRVLTD